VGAVAANKAKRILSEVEEDKVQLTSVALYPFYAWVRLMILSFHKFYQ
jgi:hypothetical protein